MKKNIILAGGGHAHLETISRIKEFPPNIQVTIVSPDEKLFYSGMAPGMIEGRYSKEDFSMNIRKISENQGGVFIKDRVLNIDPRKQILNLNSGRTVSYDLLSVDIGSITKTGINIEDSDVINVKPIENLIDIKRTINEKIAEKSHIEIAVIGAGAAGVEIASTILSHLKKKKINGELSVFSGGTFLNGFPAKLKKAAFLHLTREGININPEPVIKIEKNILYLKKEKKFYDIIIMATGATTDDIFIKSGIKTGPDSDMVVNEFLQSVQYPNIFGGGDCIFLKNHPLAKAGVHAVREGKILFHNLLNFYGNRPLKKFIPDDDFLQILNLGNGNGIMTKKGITAKGKLTFYLKNFIDQRFIRKFKSLE